MTMHGMLGNLVALGLLMIMALSSCSQPAPPTPPAAVHQGFVWSNGTMRLVLTDHPCGFITFKDELEEVGIPPAKALVVIQEGRPQVPGCWVLDFDQEVLIRDAAGGDGFVPLAWFTAVPRP